MWGPSTLGAQVASLKIVVVTLRSAVNARRRHANARLGGPPFSFGRTTMREPELLVNLKFQ